VSSTGSHVSARPPHLALEPPSHMRDQTRRMPAPQGWMRPAVDEHDRVGIRLVERVTAGAGRVVQAGLQTLVRPGEGRLARKALVSSAIHSSRSALV
jgi:hypothetical protein